MSTFSTLYFHAIPKISSRLLLVSTRSGSINIAALPISSNASLKCSSILTQFHSFWLPSIQSANFSTSQRTYYPASGDQDEKTPSFTKYEKIAKKEDFHFQNKHKLAEEKTNAIISMSEGKNKQGMRVESIVVF